MMMTVMMNDEEENCFDPNNPQKESRFQNYFIDHNLRPDGLYLQS